MVFLASDDASFITVAALLIDGGISGAYVTRSSPSGQEQRIAQRRMVTSMARSWPSTSALYSVPMSVMA